MCLKKRLYIFDADGTLRETISDNSHPPYTDTDWRLLPGREPKIKKLVQDPNVFIGVASNQAAIGRGKLTEAMAYHLLYQMMAMATGRKDLGGAVLKLCPHKPENMRCDCRKPKTGMLVAIMAHFGVTPQETVLIGDMTSDRQAAINAGCSFMWAESFFARKK